MLADVLISITFFTYDTTTHLTKMQTTPPPKQIRIVELLLYLPPRKTVQVSSDAWGHLQKIRTSTFIQTHHI
jgi:hypothetical protein